MTLKSSIFKTDISFEQNNLVNLYPSSPWLHT